MQVNKAMESPLPQSATASPSSSRRSYIPFIAVMAGGVIDLLTKEWAQTVLQPYQPPIAILPWLSVRLGYNEGVSFSLLSFDDPAAKTALLIATALLTLFFATWMVRAKGSERLALAAVLAGAIPNVIDRARDGRVTDFLDLHIGDRSFFIFNLADVWISIGALLLLSTLLPSLRAKRVPP